MIFCFSATGNSLYAARKIAESTGERVVSIGDATRDGAYSYDLSGETRVGFVIPTFAWTVPGIVARFVENVDFSSFNGGYVYGVFTCGASSGGEVSALYALLSDKGLTLSAAFDLVMPDNFIVWSSIPGAARLESMLDASDKALTPIIAAVTANTPTRIDNSPPRDKFMPLERVSPGNSKLTVNDKCVHCGLCEKICPTRCIKLDGNGSPVWDGECAVCLACLHRCPAAAIDFGRETVGKARYYNPRVR
jgi:ferredoxin/flavodoxin